MMFRGFSDFGRPRPGLVWVVAGMGWGMGNGLRRIRDALVSMMIYRKHFSSNPFHQKQRPQRRRLFREASKPHFPLMDDSELAALKSAVLRLDAENKRLFAGILMLGARVTCLSKLALQALAKLGVEGAADQSLEATLKQMESAALDRLLSGVADNDPDLATEMKKVFAHPYTPTSDANPESGEG